MEILAQSSSDFALTYNFQDTHILGASRSHLCDSVAYTSLLHRVECSSILQKFVGLQELA